MAMREHQARNVRLGSRDAEIGRIGVEFRLAQPIAQRVALFMGQRDIDRPAQQR
ncbi:MAG: hypothetical protein QM770_00930 [Tepidisphaeraceae bacterium]